MTATEVLVKITLFKLVHQHVISQALINMTNSLKNVFGVFSSFQYFFKILGALQLPWFRVKRNREPEVIFRIAR